MNEGGLAKIQLGPPSPLSREKPSGGSPTNRILSATAGKACVFDAHTLRVERRFASKHGAYSAASSPDGRHAAIWGLNLQVVEV